MELNNNLYIFVAIFLILLSFNIYGFYISKNYDTLDTKPIKAISVLSLIFSGILFLLLHKELIYFYIPVSYLYFIPIILSGLLVIFNILNAKFVFDNNIKNFKIINGLNFSLLIILISLFILHKQTNSKLDNIDKLLYESQNNYGSSQNDNDLYETDEPIDLKSLMYSDESQNNYGSSQNDNDFYMK
jgi:hypothetical protein